VTDTSHAPYAAHGDGGEEAPETVRELLDLLELEQLDTDLFRAHNPSHVEGRHRLFGGQVAAQALRAATLTVPDDRLPHSLHGYFLRPGRSDMPTIVRVDRDRDGRSISSRRVTAIQAGQVIFSMSASFQSDDRGPEFGPGLPADAPRPEEAGDTRIGPFQPLFEIRPVGEHDAAPGLNDTFWARAGVSLPGDPLVHACVLTYLSDMGVGRGELASALREHQSASVDHAIWFHRHVRLDDWVLFSMRPVSAQSGRLLYTGTFHGVDGTFAATMIQECLARPMPPETRRPGG